MARLETQSAQAQKMQAVGQLAGGVAHDFNNLLTAIIAACDLMPDSQSKEAAEIRRHARRGADLVGQLLAFSRRQTLRPVPLDLAQRTQNICDLIIRLLGAHIQFDLDAAASLWRVSADPNQFDQIIVNLAVNARDAMPKGGRLSIRIKNMPKADIAALNHILMPPGDYVLFEMADEGEGIPPEAIGNIFEPFFSTKPQGSGLGLSTVYGIVKQSHGFIFPESDQGQGTVFRIYLPRFKGQIKGEIKGERGAKKISPKNKKTSDKAVSSPPPPAYGTVLLVEDDPAIRDFSARALKNHGLIVITASSAEAALEASQAHRSPIDVLVSDVVMPGMDGIALAKNLVKQHPKLKIILISGYAEDAFRSNPPTGAPSRFLPKPFGLNELVEAVQAALNAR